MSRVLPWILVLGTVARAEEPRTEVLDALGPGAVAPSWRVRDAGAPRPSSATPRQPPPPSPVATPLTRAIVRATLVAKPTPHGGVLLQWEVPMKIDALVSGEAPFAAGTHQVFLVHSPTRFFRGEGQVNASYQVEVGWARDASGAPVVRQVWLVEPQP